MGVIRWFLGGGVEGKRYFEQLVAIKEARGLFCQEHGDINAIMDAHELFLVHLEYRQPHQQQHIAAFEKIHIPYPQYRLKYIS